MAFYRIKINSCLSPPSLYKHSMLILSRFLSLGNICPPSPEQMYHEDQPVPNQEEAKESTLGVKKAPERPMDLSTKSVQRLWPVISNILQYYKSYS